MRPQTSEIISISLVATAAFLLGAIGDAAFVNGCSDTGELSATLPTELTPAQRKLTDMLVQLPEMDFSVHVLPAELFDKIAKTKWPVTALSTRYRIAAWSDPYGHPCQIYLRAGAWLTIKPGDATSGAWLDRTDGDHLAHEIAHCVKGMWHEGEK